MTPDPAGSDGSAFLNWLLSAMGTSTRNHDAIMTMMDAGSIPDLEMRWQKIPPEVQLVPEVAGAHRLYANALKDGKPLVQDPLKKWLMDVILAWRDKMKEIGTATPENAVEKLATITEYAGSVFLGATTIDLALGAAVGTQEGLVSSNATRQILAALGVGAVFAAVAHDPVKIGVLRPYSDYLEMTFRNRRPDDNALFQAYRTRELSPVKVEDLSKLDDAEMQRIEIDNQTVYDTEIAKWGYSEWFSNALARSATRTPTFGNLMALARMGLLDRGLAIYSLWGYGMDRVTMPPLLDGLEAINEISNYGGFRSMVEPSFVDGSIEESDLVEYYDKIRVPVQVQEWVLPRLRKARAKSLITQQKVATVKERELTTSQIQSAYVNGLINGDLARSMLADLDYPQVEREILMKLADLQKKTPGVLKLQRLPLTDYEKAFKNNLRTKQDVLERMRDTYDPRDIELEKDLLEAGKA